MPSVRPGESRDSYVPRCIAYVTSKEGLDAKAAAGKCEGMYDQHTKSLGMETSDIVPPKTKVRKTMTPEEEAALKKKDGEGDKGGDKGNAPPPKEGGDKGSAPPPPADSGNAPPPDAGNAPPPDAGSADTPTGNEPPSAQVAKAVYTSLKNLQGNLDAAANTYENPEAKSYFDGPFKQKCGEMMGEIKGLIGKLGSNTGDDMPDQGADGGDGGEQPDEEAMKSFLALGNNNDLKLLGYVAPLNSLAKAKNLTPEQKLCLGGVLKSIRGLCDSAKNNAEEVKRKALSDEVSSLQKTSAATSSRLADLQKSMNSLLGK